MGLRSQLTPVSYKPDSCLPRPLCQSFTTDFNDLSRVLVLNNFNEYDGNADTWDWIGKKMFP